MNLTLLILLGLAGLFLIALDLLFIPGGLVAFFGLGLVILADYLAYQYLGTTGGHIFSLGSFLASGFFIYQLFRPSFWKRVSIGMELEGKVNTEDADHIHVQDSGITIGQLRPYGKVLINGRIVEAQSEGNTIVEDNTSVTVVELDGNKIIVQPAS